MAYTPEQRRNIAEALRLTRGDRRKVRKSLLEAMAVESNFRHVNYGDRDSLGVLQQRPSQGWGAYNPGIKGVRQDIMDYLVRARRLAANGYRGTAGQLAQAVQRSAFPERYDERGSQVEALLRQNLALIGGSSGSRMIGGAKVSYGLSTEGVGRQKRQELSSYMLDQLAHSQMTGNPAGLNNAAALSQMMANNTGPAYLEDKPETSTTAPVGRGVRPAKGVMTPKGSVKGIEELIMDQVGSVFDGVFKAGAYGGHGSHVHYANDNPREVLAAIRLAQKLGLTVRENPYVDPVDPVHTKGSHHYRTFPGRYNGRRLGQAIDVSGPLARRRKFYRRLSGI